MRLRRDGTVSPRIELIHFQFSHYVLAKQKLIKINITSIIPQYHLPLPRSFPLLLDFQVPQILPLRIEILMLRIFDESNEQNNFEHRHAFPFEVFIWTIFHLLLASFFVFLLAWNSSKKKLKSKQTWRGSKTLGCRAIKRPIVATPPLWSKDIPSSWKDSWGYHQRSDLLSG